MKFKVKGETKKQPFFVHKTCVMVGAPMCFGQGHTGVADCPGAVRACGLEVLLGKLGWQFEDHGDVGGAKLMAEEPSDLQNKKRAEEKKELAKEQGEESVRNGTGRCGQDHQQGVEYYDNVKGFANIGSGCRELFEAAYKAASSGKFTLVVGGDHSIATGSIAASLRRHPNLAVLWVDAHADCNTPETSPSLNYHGMPAAHLMGWFKKQAPGFEWLNDIPRLKESNLAYIGLRQVDAGERRMLEESSVEYFTMQDVDHVGIATAVADCLRAIDPNGDRPIHLSFDIDACDPLIAPGTGTLARGGLTYREAHYICEAVHATGRLVAMDMVEINPSLDPVQPDGTVMHGDDPDMAAMAGPTVKLGVDLICSALGKTIM